MIPILQNFIDNLTKIGIVDTTPAYWAPTVKFEERTFVFGVKDIRYFPSNLESLLKTKPNATCMKSVLNDLLIFSSKSYLTHPVAALVSNEINGVVNVVPIGVEVDFNNKKLKLTPNSYSPVHLPQLLIWRTGVTKSSLFRVSTKDLRRGEVSFSSMLNKEVTTALLDNKPLDDMKVGNLFSEFKPLVTPKDAVLVSNNWVSKPDTNLIFKIE